MALPTSGNLSLSQVRAEFGAPAAIGLAAFLRGGPWVPDTTANAGVPSVLPIGLRQLLGASAVVNHSVFAPDIDAGSISPDDPSGSSTATVSNGIGPFTHSWAWVSGGGGITLSGQTTQTVTASHTGITGVFTGVLRDSVTDTGNGGLIATWDISVTLEKTL